MPQTSRRLMIFNAVTVVLVAIAAGLVFFYAPRERVMGDVQRIFYFHVPSAWVGFLAFFVQLFLGPTFRIWYPLWLMPFAALNLNSSTYWRTFLFGITAELSILSYYILWRWGLHHWDWGEHGPYKKYWDYWLIMTWLTVPWTFGIPLLLPFLRRRKNQQAFDNSLWID